jgi:hypothetical protein
MSGHATAEPAIALMNSRRRTQIPCEAKDDASIRTLSDEGGNVRFGSKADMCSAQAHVRFTPESGHRAGVMMIRRFPLKLKTTNSVDTACIMRNLTQPIIRSS